MDIQWVFFDVGGVLLDDSEAERMRRQVIASIVSALRPGVSEAEVMAVLPRASALQGKLNDNLIYYLLDDPSARKAAKQEMQNQWEHNIRYIERSNLRPEAQEVIQKLAQKYKLGFMANQSAGIKIKLAPILPYFTQNQVSEDWGHDKPDPEFFKIILKETQANPCQCVIIDDNIERGLLPAKSLGMETIWYKIKDREIPQEKIDYTITSLTELLQIL